MNVKFVKDWKNPETGKTHKKDTFHKIGTSAAKQLIKQGYCLEMPDDLGLLQLYRNPEMIPQRYLEQQRVEPEDPVNDDLGTVTRKAKGFFNRK